MNKFKLEIGQRIEQLMYEKGIKRKDLCDKLDISQQAIAKWSSGQSAPSIENLQKLSSILGVKIDALINGEKDEIEDKEDYER